MVRIGSSRTASTASSPGSAKRFQALIVSRYFELLAQGERSVDSLASEIGLSIANTSQHLQALRQAALVESRKDGLFVHYRLADPEVFELAKVIRSVAERRLADLDRLVHEHFGNRTDAEPVPMDELLKRARSKQVVVLDTRPASELHRRSYPGCAVRSRG